MGIFITYKEFVKANAFEIISLFEDQGIKFSELSEALWLIMECDCTDEVQIDKEGIYLNDLYFYDDETGLQIVNDWNIFQDGSVIHLVGLRNEDGNMVQTDCYKRWDNLHDFLEDEHKLSVTA